MINYYGTISYSLPQPSNQTVLLIGTASQGPVLAPVYASSVQQAANCFGSGALVDAYTDAYNAGGRYLYLVRIDPSSSSDTGYVAAFDELLGYLLDLPYINIYPADLSVDSIPMIPLLATYCYNRLQRGMNSHVILGFRPNSDAAWDFYLLDWISQARAGMVVNDIDVSACFSLVGAQFTRGSGVLASAGAVYAGLIAATTPGISLTNKPTGLPQVANNFTETQCSALADAGIVTFYKTVRRGIAVYHSVTCAGKTSAYHELYCYRTAVEISERLNSIDRQYLGLAVGSPVNGVAMNNAIQNMLKGAVSDGLITDFSFDFQIVPNKNQVVVNASIGVPGLVYDININTVVLVV